ncbi:MAG: T9SS type A sorting domain-containing protein [Chitinophagaceae bacterium]|nr:T9SS type A sorting domain-containing protein [Chitinophagaceae bacterium]
MKKNIPSLLMFICFFALVTKTKAQTALNSNKIFAKTTETKSRVIAEAKYDYSLSSFRYHKRDSTKLLWSGTAGHYQRFNQLEPNFLYDNASETEYYKFENDTVSSATKTLRVYDTRENVTDKIEFRWNKATSTWDTIGTTHYVFMGGKLIQDEKKIKVSGMGKLVLNGKNLYTYKAGLLDEKITYVAAFIFTGTLRFYSKTNYGYTGTVLSSISEALWDSSASVSPGFYNSNRFLLTISGKDTTQKTTQTWDNSINDWKNVERTSYDFSKGIYSEDLVENWNAKDSKWNYYKCDSLIYVSGALAYHIFYYWNATTKTWGPSDVSNFVFSGKNLEKIYVLQWDGTKWSDNYVMVYAYDANNNLISRNAYLWDGAAYSSPTTYNARTYYYYEDYSTTSLKEKGLITSNAKLYPNPAVSNHSYLDYFTAKNVATEVQVVDMMGREVLRINEAGYIGDHSVLLQLDNLANGVYIVNLISEGKMEVQLKLIK